MCIDLDILFFASLRCIFNYKEEFEDTKVAIRMTYIGEEQTTQWPKKSTKGQTTIYKTYI
jgi:hypothetical protein